MENFTIFLVALAPIEVLLEKVTDAMTQYTIDPSKDNFTRLASCCQMVVVRELVGGEDSSSEKTAKLIEKMRNFDSVNSILNPDPN